MDRLHWPALSTNPAISVVICCHNSAAVLPPTLMHLAAQIVDPSVQWEVVVIDNASTDDTVAGGDARLAGIGARAASSYQ